VPAPSKSPVRIAAMFNAIAGRYDLLNHLLSAGIDQSWRRRAIRSLALTGRERVLDVCTGTADLAIAAKVARPGAAEVVGVDFASAMLRVGLDKVRRRRVDRVALVHADATRLPVADASVDALTVAFGIRNVEDLGTAIDEMSRALRPGDGWRFSSSRFRRSLRCGACISGTSTISCRASGASCRGTPTRTSTCRRRWAALPRPISSSRC